MLSALLDSEIFDWITIDEETLTVKELDNEMFTFDDKIKRLQLWRLTTQYFVTILTELEWFPGTCNIEHDY